MKERTEEFAAKISHRVDALRQRAARRSELGEAVTRASRCAAEGAEALQNASREWINQAERAEQAAPLLLLKRRKALCFRELLRRKRSEFHRGTRTWAFTAVKNWLRRGDTTSAERLFWLKGGAGTGKSAWSAELARKRGAQMAAVHMCVHNDSTLSDPARMLQSIAAQLCTSIDGFENQLLSLHAPEQLRKLLTATGELGELFDALLAAPLAGLESDGCKRKAKFILIDALDESAHAGQNALLNVVSKLFPRLPSWIRLVVTSRDETAIVDKLKDFTTLSLNCDEAEKNAGDAREYLSHILESKVGDLHAAVNLMMKKSSGLFLYIGIARARLEKIGLGQNEHHSLETLESFPDGMDDVYTKNFDRVFGEGAKAGSAGARMKWPDVRPLLEMICAAREPLMVDVARDALRLPGVRWGL